MFGKWKKRRNCFHHDWTTGTSWIKSALIDAGRGKVFWCMCCHRDWYV